MTRAERREEWRARVAAFRASGQSMRAWCAAQGVKLHQLQYWLPRVAPVEPPATRSAPWLPLAVQDQESPLGDNKLLVRVGPAVIEVQPGFDPGLLTAVVKALRALC